MSIKNKPEIGKALPLGVSLHETGVNFSLFSRHASAVSLILFVNDKPDSAWLEVELNPKKNKTGDIWHCYIPGLKAGTCYLYRADGLYNPEKGYRYNFNKLLLDPYAKALTDLSTWNRNACKDYDPTIQNSSVSPSYIDSIAHHPRCIVVDDSFDWQGDKPLNYPLRFSVLYETHIKGLSKRAGANVQHPGTYLGVIETIPYLKDLGITSLEFLPIQDFYENEITAVNPKTSDYLANYWGYSTIAFFAPKGSYAADRNPGGQVSEFKKMVRELHKAGIEVILDIVFNHTAEGNEEGPVISFRGLDNTIYYLLEEDRRYYRNYSGCGNTVNCNHPVVRTFIIDCLQYWVTEMHVDGFRFDLGSILGRDQKGRLMENPPMLERIAEDPVLSSTKIIAEAWDAGGAYQVGWFPGGRWAEWNDRYRDEIRRYWRKLGSALLDRIELRVPVFLPGILVPGGSNKEEKSVNIRQRVIKATEIQRERFCKYRIRRNNQMSSEHLEKFCSLTNSAENAFSIAAAKLGFSGRACHGVLKIARTIADLGEKPSIDTVHILEAVQHRRFGDDPYDILNAET
jgi:glycogen operon protein